jgi:hypothetical protein
MLLDRIAHACNECQRVIVEKSNAATAHEEARIARQLRERAAAGLCCICLEENPNILTICCGQAIHLNCLAEWLGTASNCVACRKPLPTLQVRNPQSTTQVEERLPMPPDLPSTEPFTVNAHSNSRNDVWSRVLTNMLWEAAESAGEALCDYHECSNRAANDCPNFMCRICCQMYGEVECYRHGDFPQLQQSSATASDDHTAVPEEDDYGNNSLLPLDISPGPPMCRSCTNRAAVDCENQMCGRHCVMRGWYSCIRHNTFR